MAKLIVYRNTGLMGMAAPLGLILDDHPAGEIHQDQSCSVEISPGVHTLACTSKKWISEPVSFSVAEGEEVTYEIVAGPWARFMMPALLVHVISMFSSSFITGMTVSMIRIVLSIGMAIVLVGVVFDRKRMMVIQPQS